MYHSLSIFIIPKTDKKVNMFFSLFKHIRAKFQQMVIYSDKIAKKVLTLAENISIIRMIYNVIK